jgi:hypothetical protein
LGNPFDFRLKDLNSNRSLDRNTSEERTGFKGIFTLCLLSMVFVGMCLHEDYVYHTGGLILLLVFDANQKGD